MRGLKKGISAALTAALILTALPANGIGRVNAEGTDADVTVKALPTQASTFHDTNFDGLGEFEGWGTSLCWWANRLGYDETLTKKAADAFYGPDGLNMNIGRYNVGGGDNVYDADNEPEILPNPKATVYGLEGDTKPTYGGTSMEVNTNSNFESATYTVSDADFGFTAGRTTVGSFPAIGWINEIGEADSNGGNLNYTVNVAEAGKYTIKMLCTLEGSNRRGMAIRVNGSAESEIVVGAPDINSNVIASTSKAKLFLVTFSNVELTAGVNAVAIGGKGGTIENSESWAPDFIKMLVVKSGEEGELPQRSEFAHPSHIERSDSAIPGYCKNVTKMDLQAHDMAYYTAKFARADETSGYAWDYDWNADKNQIAILKAAMKASGKDFIAEAFSNSPPYFMTNSGCSSGSVGASTDNLRKDCYKAFAAYMADVIVHWAEDGSIEFTSTTPMNEPYTNFWPAYSPKQEGCHFDQGESESTIIEELNAELQRQLKATTNQNVKKVLGNLIISGTDETSIDTAITSYGKLSENAKNIIQRIDTHTYSGSKRAELCALAEKEGKNLWMSEIDVGKVAGTNPGEMGAALCFAQRIITDLNGLKASAWIMWNAIDVHIDRNSTSIYDAKESVEEMKNLTYDDGTIMYDPANYGYWGVAIADHNNKDLILTRKYDAYGQFSRYIRPGYTILGNSDTNNNTLFAYDSQGKKVVVVAINTSDSQKTYKFDLSQFKTMGSKVEAYRTSGPTDGGEKWADVSENASIIADTADKSVTAALPANSITTFIVAGTEYDVEENYETAEKAIQNQIMAEVNKENDSVMEANRDSVEGVTLNEDMVTGTDPWDNNCSAQKVVDGSYTTYFDGLGGGWVQIDLGKQEKIAGFGYVGRSGYEYRCVEGSFYGSNDGQAWTKLYTITEAPAKATLIRVDASKFAVPNNTSYRYIKYATPEQGDGNNNCCNMAEIEVYRWKDGVNVPEFKETTIPEDLKGWTVYYNSQTAGNSNSYSKESWAAYQKALDEADALIKSGSTDTSELNKARRNLAVAYLGLKPEKATQTINVNKNFTRAYGDAAFKLNAKVKTGDGTLSYKSSDEKVAKVDNNGKVTIKGIGSCTITITASETDNYKKNTATVTIKVNPKKAVIKNPTPGKQSLKVTWNKDTNATGYEVQCCLNKKFKSGVKTNTVKKAKTTVTTFKKLKKGKTYYVRVRAYKNIKVKNKTTKYTGAWSKVLKSNKIK